MSQDDRRTVNVCSLTSPQIILSAKLFRPVKVQSFVVQHCLTLTLKNCSDQTFYECCPVLRLALFSLAHVRIIIGQTGGKLINCCVEKYDSISVVSLCVVVFRKVNQTLSRPFCTAKPKLCTVE